MINLDTHIFLFALEGQLKANETKLLKTEPWSISSIVIWEITKLTQLGRIELDIDSAEFSRALGQVQIWPIDLRVCREIPSLDFKGDPADEIIAATSVVQNVPLLTRDRAIKRSRVVPLA